MPEETRDRWVELVSLICQTNQCLENLVVKNTASSAWIGEEFLQALSESRIDRLRQSDFSGGQQVILGSNDKEFVNNEWFED